jgi:putative lipoprotein
MAEPIISDLTQRTRFSILNKKTRNSPGLLKFILIVLCCALALTAGCSNGGKQADAFDESISVSNQALSQTYVYDCSDGYGFVARIEGEKAWLFLPNGTISLPHVRSASGARYSQGPVTFWSKGEEALLETGENSHRNCRNNRRKAIWEDAKLNGIDFRAVGNEPGWYLEIKRGDIIVFVGDYGQSRYQFATPAPFSDQQARKTTYRVDDGGHDLMIVIEGRSCGDTMSDETFESTVTVTLDGKKYRGCGRALH